MFGSSGQVFVYNKTKETFLAFRVDVADSFSGRLIGLLGKRSLKPDSGVWIVPANAIHTVGMMFSFDVVMIDKDFKVVSVKELVKPFRVILPKLRAESVIELPAHTIFKSRTEVGDQLIIDPYEAKKLSTLPAEVEMDKRVSNVTPIGKHREEAPRIHTTKSGLTSFRQ